MKKLLLILLIGLSSLFAAENNSQVCGEPIVTEYFPIGDTRGNIIFTKKEEVRDCSITKTVIGECKVWQEDKYLTGLSTEAYDSYRTKDFADTIGELMAALGAYDQIMHLWSGVRGYCISGTLQDFSWAGDPMFWGSLAASSLMQSGALDDTMFDIGSETGDVLNDGDVWANGALGIQDLTNLGKCMASGVVNIGTGIADSIKELDGGPIDCDPIDEICEDELGPQEENIQTMDKVAFDDLRDQWTEMYELGEVTTTFESFIEVLDDGSDDGVVTYILHEVGDDSASISGMDNAQIEKMQQDAQMMQIGVNTALAVADMTSCLMADSGEIGGGIIDSAGGDSSDNMMVNAAKAGASKAIQMASNLAPPPMNVVFNIVGQVMLEFATSFSSVDSCSDEDDASAQGSRHTMTQKSLKFDLCRPIYEECIDEWIWGGCCLTGFHHCCYDQILTKVLVTQMMAQLGRDYAHCAGISISDLNHISFEQCTTTEMNDGIDGATQYGRPCSTHVSIDGCWEPTEAFQYKHKCMDLTEFKDYLASQISEDIDMDNFDDYWKDVTKSEPY